MAYSNQTLHRLPILICDDVGDNKKHKDLTGIRVNNVCYTDGIVRKYDQATERAHVKTSKYKSRRQSSSRNKVKSTLSICSSYIKRLLHARSKAHTSRTYNKQRRNSHQTKRIKVLFSSEARKLKKKRNSINKKLIDDIYDFNAKSYYHSLQHTFNIPYLTNLKNQQNIHYCEVPKKSRSHIRKDYTLKTSNFDNLCKINSKPSNSNGIPPKYKVVQFPNCDPTDTQLEAVNKEISQELESLKLKTENKIYEEKEIQVAASMPYFSNAKRGGGDGRDVGIQCSVTKKDPIEGKKAENKQCFHNFDPIVTHGNALYLAKITLKYLILGLLLIVWSPCIIILYFCWFVTYPLRPTCTSVKAARVSKCRRNSQVKVYMRGSKRMIDSSVQTCGNNIWSFLFRGISWIFHLIVVLFEAFKVLLNSGKNNGGYHCSRQPRSTNGIFGNKDHFRTSDREKQYMLQYSRNKGCVMKSAKRRSRNCKNIEHNVKTVPNITYDLHNIKRYNNRNNINERSPYLERCPRQAENCVVHKNVKNDLQNHNRCNHLYPDTSGMSDGVKLLTPVFSKKFSCKIGSNVRPYKCYYKNSKRLTRKPVGSPTVLQKKSSRGNAIRKEAQFKKHEPVFKSSNKIRRYYKKAKRNMKSIIDGVETEVFGNNKHCEKLYIDTLRRKPCYYVNKSKCLSRHHSFVGIYKVCENICHFFLLFISACVWCPVLGFCYLCYAIFCRCL